MRAFVYRSEREQNDEVILAELFADEDTKLVFEHKKTTPKGGGLDAQM